MLITPRAAVVAAFGLVPLLLAAGCGSSTGDGAGATLSPIAPSSYVTIEPATTTTSTTLAPNQTTPEGGGISTSEQTYTVVAGDSLSKIASLYKITVDVLCNYNGWTDCPGHLILPGDPVLIPPNTPIPGSPGATTPPAGTSGGGTPTPTTAPPASGSGCTHTVVDGDNPTRVAKKYGITVAELAAANEGNPAYDNFLLGSQLTIPANGTC
jgi:peptidoglycan endopeptidase LytE